METVCAFLNGQGGIIFIGVTDYGQLVGQEIGDSTKKTIAHEITKIEPPVHIKIEYVVLDKNKYIIVLHVPAGNHLPYVYDGRAYHRIESRTNRMPQHKYDQLLLQR